MEAGAEWLALINARPGIIVEKNKARHRRALSFQPMRGHTGCDSDQLVLPDASGVFVFPCFFFLSAE